MVSFLKRYQYHQTGTPPPSGQSRHLRLPLVLPYPCTTHRGFSTSPTSHSDSLHSFFLRTGSSSPNLLSHLRFGQTWSETKTADRPGELMRPLTRSCFLLLVLGRLLFLFFCFICHFYPPFTRKRIVSLYFGRYVRTRLGVAFFEVYGPPVFHIKAGHPVKCLAQGRNKRTCRLVLHNLP